MSHRGQGLDEREHCPISRGHHGVQVVFQLIEGLKGPGNVGRIVCIDHYDRHELFIVVGEQVEFGIFLHGLLHGNGSCVDVGKIGRIIEPDCELGLDQGVRFNVEARDDSCETFSALLKYVIAGLHAEVGGAALESAPEFGVTVGVGLDDGSVRKNDLDCH